MAFTLAGPAQYQEDVRKSRFLARAGPVQSVAEAEDFLSLHRFPAASHHCWAWRIGSRYRFHDDGEPGGTAGRPILQAIESQDCDRVVVLVVRWFGGIKLGTGGLVRAYGGTAAQCLRTADTIEIVHECTVRYSCPFAAIARVRVRLEDIGARIVDEHYTAEGVDWELAIARDRLSHAAQVLGDLTRGQGLWTGSR